MTKKISKLQIFRFITQILFLFLLPGLFNLAFSEVRQIYSQLIGHSLNSSLTLSNLIELLIILPLTIISGRFFCGWICAFGTFNDLIYMITSKLFKFKFIINEKLDSALKYIKYLILLFIIVVMWTMSNNSFNSFSPWNTFAQLPEFKEAIFQYTGGFIFLSLITIGAMFIERFFCRYLCPLGAIFAITSKLKIFKIHKYRDKCGKCRICTNNCSMGIKLYEVDIVNSGECINCMKCISSCPRSNTQTRVVNRKVNSMIASASVIAIFIVLYSISNIMGSKIIGSNIGLASDNNSSTSTNASQSDNNSNDEAQKKYNDGTYTGVGRGYRPNLKVSVTIKSNKITDIQIVSDNETPRYASVPFDTIPKEIIDSQSTDVDTISGATRTSNGIMDAVEDALSQAESNKSTESNVSQDNNSIENKSSNESNIKDETSSNRNNYPSEDSDNNKFPNENFRGHNKLEYGDKPQLRRH